MRLALFPAQLPGLLPARLLLLPLLLSVPVLTLSALAAPRFSQAELEKIGRMVWQNEASGSVDGLTAWNAGENFASLGIGHFIWYPKGQRGPFDESFPKLVRFMEARGAKPPAWVAEAGACPWDSKAEFERDFRSERTVALRKFLANTIHTQAEFLVQRMEQALPKILAEADSSRRERVRQAFEQLNATPRGAFALIDYVNFKGEGTLATERYKGEGWGMLQVLENMDAAQTARDPVGAFAESAKEVLTRRVRNSPPERKEERWLPGWKNRVARYAQ